MLLHIVSTCALEHQLALWDPNPFLATSLFICHCKRLAASNRVKSKANLEVVDEVKRQPRRNDMDSEPLGIGVGRSPRLDHLINQRLGIELLTCCALHKKCTKRVHFELNNDRWSLASYNTLSSTNDLLWNWNQIWTFWRNFNALLTYLWHIW